MVGKFRSNFNMARISGYLQDSSKTKHRIKNGGTPQNIPFIVVPDSVIDKCC